ncbi:hypothetical protein KFE25_013604 [Diacronema lutheri]|uniref:peptidylprolyl isomerase n=1 Tax=Diacronema lutheri TaxID=2081491 RepID=A0A8J5XGN8_DIALT|nr:hypothetical protein KFE25_013604 [Diacronema lutheri]
MLPRFARACVQGGVATRALRSLSLNAPVRRTSAPVRCLSLSTPNVMWRELKATSQVSWRNKPADIGQIVRAKYVARKALGGADGFEPGEVLESGTVSFRLGSGKAFGAFDEAVVGMCVGDVRRIRAPHTMAYGVKGKPPKIGPFEEVVFEVTLTGCVHQMHIEVLEAEGNDHSVESIVAAVSRTAQSAGRSFGNLLANLASKPGGRG